MKSKNKKASNREEDSQVEIQKWILARKRNYPSKNNIEMKQKMMQEKIKKGIPITNSVSDQEISLLEKKLKKKVNMVSKNDRKFKIYIP